MFYALKKYMYVTKLINQQAFDYLIFIEKIYIFKLAETFCL